MIPNNICEALYALPGGVVEPRRQPICKPVMAAIVGAVLLIINLLAIDDKSGALGMTLMVAGITMLIFGIILTAVRLTSDKRVPYHTPTKRYMCYRERYYDRAQLEMLKKYVASGDRMMINSLQTGNVAAITLVEYSSADDSLVAYALYEYFEFDNRLIGEIKIIRR